MVCVQSLKVYLYATMLLQNYFKHIVLFMTVSGGTSQAHLSMTYVPHGIKLYARYFICRSTHTDFYSRVWPSQIIYKTISSRDPRHHFEIWCSAMMKSLNFCLSMHWVKRRKASLVYCCLYLNTWKSFVYSTIWHWRNQRNDLPCVYLVNMNCNAWVIFHIYLIHWFFCWTPTCIFLVLCTAGT